MILKITIGFFCIFCLGESLGFAQYLKGYEEVGLATFYASKFQGRRTSSGERYTHSKRTGAHSNLPFGTRVKVTNLNNGKTTFVKINDRWSPKSKTIIDLSRRAAIELDMIRSGYAKIKLEIADLMTILEDEPLLDIVRTELVNEDVLDADMLLDMEGKGLDYKGVSLQIGSYASFERALEMLYELQSLSIEPMFIVVANLKEFRAYRVMVGVFEKNEDGELAKKILKDAGYKPFFKLLPLIK